MSSPLRIELRPAPWLRAILAGLAALAVVALLLSSLPAGSVVVVAVLLALAWPRPTGHDGSELVLRDDGTAVLLAPDGSEIEASPVRLQRRGWLTLLTLRARDRMLVHLFTPATLDAAAARRLGLWFERHGPQFPRDTAVPGV